MIAYFWSLRSMIEQHETKMSSRLPRIWVSRLLQIISAWHPCHVWQVKTNQTSRLGQDFPQIWITLVSTKHGKLLLRRMRSQNEHMP